MSRPCSNLYENQVLKVIEMGSLKVLKRKPTVFNVQKFTVSNSVLPASSHGKFAVISSSPGTYCLCQIFLSPTLHPSFCHIDLSVCGSSSTEESKVYPAEITVDTIALSSINILHSAEHIKTVSLVVVFNTSIEAKQWKLKLLKLSDLVKNILKLFVLKKNCVVYLDGITDLFDTLLNCFLVESIGNIEVGKVVNSTKIKINTIISKITLEQVYRNRGYFDVLGGLEEPTKKLREIMKCVKTKMSDGITVYKQVLVLGQPGCGKTALVRQVARECDMVVKALVGPELCSPLPGESEQALTNVFNECKLLAQEAPGGCVLLIHQVESLCRRREGSADGHLVRLSNQLFTLIETVNSTDGLAVVGTSSRPQAIDPAARRPGHFDHEIHIGVCTEEDRRQIVLALCPRYQLTCSETMSGKIAKWTPGFVGADLALLATNVARRLETVLSKNPGEEELLSHWYHCVSRLQPSALRGQLGLITGNKGSLSDLGGVEGVKRSLLQAIQWPLTHPEAFKRLGLPQPKGVLLYGPPGCAKTSLVRAVASAANTTFLSVSAAQIYSPYVGDAERTISELFHRARIGSPAILFIDEIDALVGCRGDREKGSQERILSAFLTEMDGVGVKLDSGTGQAGVVVVAATNRPDVLDPALTRPGRFDRILYVPPPDTDQRLDILRILTQKMPLNNDVDLKYLAENTNMFSGADLSQLCKEAGLCAMTREGMDVETINHEHWLFALQEMKPSLTQEQICKYQQMDVFGNTNV